jgi:hypothetical protein
MTENTLKCQKCGSPVTPGMKFCESCGAKIDFGPVCSGCGAPLMPGVKFCESCGKPVAAAAPGAPVETPPAAGPVTPPAAPSPEISRPVETPAPIQEVKQPEEKPEPVPEKKPEAAVPAKQVVHETPKETAPKKPIPQTTIIIAGVIVLAVLAAAAYFVVLPMLSGSGTPLQNQQQPQGTSGPGSSSGNPATTADVSQTGTFSLTAGPTQVPPSNRALVVDVERDAISHMITVTFQGGEGQYGVRELLVTVTKSDGTIETKSFKPENRGSFITLKGTEKTDRVEVTANFYNGETYKIVDHVFEYKKRVGSE